MKDHKWEDYNSPSDRSICLSCFGLDIIVLLSLPSPHHTLGKLETPLQKFRHRQIPKIHPMKISEKRLLLSIFQLCCLHALYIFQVENPGRILLSYSKLFWLCVEKYFCGQVCYWFFIDSHWLNENLAVSLFVRECIEYSPLKCSINIDLIFWENQFFVFLGPQKLCSWP